MNFRKVLFLSLLAPAFLTPGADALSTGRFDHTTTLLPDGNILIAGGRTNTGTATGDVEMYNMATNTYQDWGSLITARSSHTATLMSDGRVLIAGGFNASGTPLNTTYICNPATKACAASGAMQSSRGGHTATLLSKGPKAGQVLLCGGQSGAVNTSITQTCEFFSPAGASSWAGSMVSAREGHAATLLRSGKVFVTGGMYYNSGWDYESRNELYDPTADQWTPVSALDQGRVSHTATVLNNGLIMIAGGYNGTNYAYCQATDPESLEDECWHIKYDITDSQDYGNHGYLDGAEFFDQNGARVILQESTYGEIPYRVANQSAILDVNGLWRMQGGYGGIVPTFFTDSPQLSQDTTIYLLSDGQSNHTADIQPSSLINFPLKLSLSRPVSGRLVNADAFFSKPADSKTASFTQDTGKFYLNASTAPVDGDAVGLLLGETFNPGDFASKVRLQNPAGKASFTTVQATSGDSGNTTVVTPAFTMGTLYPTQSKPIGGNMTVQVTLTLPNTYRNLLGVASIVSGQITDSGSIYSVTLTKSGTGPINIANPSSCDAQKQTCIFAASILFTGISGTITNTTALAGGTTVYQNSPQVFPDVSVNDGDSDHITLSLELDYIPQKVLVLDRQDAYSFDRSTMVVRGMVFSNQLGYAPDTNKWTDLTNKIESPAMLTPVFNHTSVLTPAGDTAVLGGRNCETSPATDCLRGAMTFNATTAGTTFIPVYKNQSGSEAWPAGEKLKTKRAFHTSTLLPDGSILTCGGSDGVTALSSCELMDPAAKTWSDAAPMSMPRANHTATLLPNGNVLVAGGVTLYGVAVSSAEIYYPATHRWVPTTSMANARQLHTATLLADGNVLVAGGDTLSTYTATAEIYISSSSYWMNTGSMTNGRAQHTATLLKNGNVLMAGGINALGPLKSVEIYNYLTHTFSPASDMNIARYAHTANLLRDGNVIVTGGSDGIDSMKYFEIYNGAAWSIPLDPKGKPIRLNVNRANHRTVLLPNGKLMLTGGEMRGTVQSVPEGYDPDYISWTIQGAASGRTHHTSLMTKDNMLVTIGGWDGSKYLNTTEIINFNFYPDMNGLAAETTRQAVISTVTALFNNGDMATLLSDTSNFHGITEASGGGAASANSSFSNPRVYMQQMDNPSGFMIDLSTRIYSIYGGPNTSWESTLSSITIITPNLPAVMPHGWYTMRVAANGVFSDGRAVQVTGPRPTGAPSVPVGTVLGTSSITWTWNDGSISFPGGADGYNIYSSSDNLFITTAAFTATASYTQTGLAPNTAISIMVGGYNLGGNGPLSKSVTYYTLAAAPTSLNVTAASFETAALEWDGNDNSAITTYEISMAPTVSPKFSSALDISTPVPFSVNYTSTSTVISQLSANQPYDFRVRAVNGAGILTGFSNIATTVTVSSVNNFSGQALSSSTINWSWDAAQGATYYEVYDVTSGTASAVFVGSTTQNNLSQTGLSANHQYYAVVAAINDTTGFGPISGPLALAPAVYTLTVQPLPGTPNIYTGVTTSSITVNWITNGNSTWTVYAVTLSTGVSISSRTTTSNSQTFSGLLPNVRYYFTLTPINGDGITGTAVDLGSKYTLAKVPASLAATDISMSGITLAWDTAGNSTGTIYEVRSSTSDVFAAPVLTHIPFWSEFTGDTTLVSGLLTSTSYYFDVAACNGEGISLGCTGYGVTARKRAVAAFTLPGPESAPSGSIGGTSDPSKNVTIDGYLPNNRRITLTIPSGTFASATDIAVSSSDANKCGYLAGGLMPVGVAIFSQDNKQPQEPVTLTLRFDLDPAAVKNDIIAKASQIVLARYNPVSGQCLPLETKVNIGDRTITATLNHFSLFQLALRVAASDLSNVLIYPNPFYPNRGNGFVTIDKIPANAKIRIYTLSGEKVWEAAADTTGMIIWKGVNKSGYLVASGIYLVVIDSYSGKKVFKVAVER